MGTRLQNVVVINGKKYSVDTGTLLHDLKPVQVATATLPKQDVAQPVKRLINSNRPTDLRKPQQVSHHPHHVDLRHAKPHAIKKSVTAASRPVLVQKPHNLADGITSKRPKSIKSHKPAHVVHSKLSSSASAHRLPHPKTPRISHVAIASHTKSIKAAASPAIKLSSGTHDARRIRAAQHRRHDQISKFAAARRHHATATPRADIQETVVQIQRPAGPSLHERLAASQAAIASAIAEHHPRHYVSEAAKVSKATKDAPVAEAARASIFDLLRLNNKLAPIVASSIACLVIVGYLTYLNVPNLAMRVAANRAGFDASMPAFTPNGYAFAGPIAYDSGQVTVDFRNNNESNKSYSLSQRKSAWNSQSLVENVVEKEDNDYITFENRGLTIYVYDSKATWVNGGVWYTINAESSQLNTDQIVRIASSL